MSYNAVVLPVMIASPSDVESERKIIRDVLHDWNDVNAASKQLVLLPVGWETHTSPQLGASGQDQINKKILEKCDILIAVFWNRIGTPTKTEKSGTIEEIKKHYNAGKTTLVYFSDKLVNFDDVDLKQRQELQEFKSWCMANGLIQKFNTPEEFKEKLAKQIQITINESDYISEIINNSVSSGEGNNIIAVVSSVDAVITSIDERSAQLLIAAAKSNDGCILKMAYMGGDIISANGQQFNKDNSPRDQAYWRSVLNRFIDQGLVEPAGDKGQILKLTEFGFEVADELTPA